MKLVKGDAASARRTKENRMTPEELARFWANIHAARKGRCPGCPACRK